MKNFTIKKLRRILGAVLSFALVLLSGLPAFSENYVEVETLDPRLSHFEYKPGEVILKFKDSSNVSVARKNGKFHSASNSAVDQLLRSIGIEDLEPLMPLSGSSGVGRKMKSYNGTEVIVKDLSKLYVVKIADLSSEPINIHQVIEQLEGLEEVEYAGPNYLVHALETDFSDINDPYYSLQYGLQDINLPELWAQPVISKDGPIIAILDTGVDITHPDLAANIWTNSSEANGASGYDDDRNGFIDDIHGWDFVNQTGNIVDYNGHGTHCAGIAAACGFNNIGIVGANPDARIMPLTVLQSNGQGDIATIIKALDYASANGADIISMSLGSYSYSMAFEDALARAYSKSVIIAAAGNDGLCLNHAHFDKGQNAPMPMYPAAYTFVLGVQATTSTGSMASFSNYDDNGPTYSLYGENKLYNYELKVPGISIMSTYPGGGYKELNGTSMATPLVAGAVSRLLQAKEYINKEELFGDLINSKTEKGNLDIYAAYAITDKDRNPEIQFVTLEMVDADGDGQADAGEVVEFYPVIRNTWGTAKNIKFNVECAETQNTTFDILSGVADFGVNLSSYGKAKSLNPVKIKFNDDVVDGRIVRLKFTATADNAKDIEQELEVMVENAVELTGILNDDITLIPDQHYVVKGTFGIPSGITLTILPGTILKLKNQSVLIVEGKIIANGTPDKLIVFTNADLDFDYCDHIDFGNNEISYCKFSNLNFSSNTYAINAKLITKCLFENIIAKSILMGNQTCNLSQLHNLTTDRFQNAYAHFNYSNLTNCNSIQGYYSYGIMAETFKGCNVFSNYIGYSDIPISFLAGGKLELFTPNPPNYLGTSDLNIAKNNVIDVNHILNSQVKALAEYDLSNMPDKPFAEAPGIVWKVVVNDEYDAQDDFSAMPPLGVGTHKFDIYFNRKMNTAVEPMVAMGVRAPYTSVGVGERGSWNAEGNIYTVYLTINGKSSYDGLNRIYVSGAEDDEFFPIPVEDSRFNVLVQAAGSLSDGFMAEAGLGRVNLTWDNTEENFDDMLGLNMYRYEINEDGTTTEPVIINQQLLEPKVTELTDYDVTTKKTYGYYYKVMRTDLAETSASKIVVVTPLTASLGDANGSETVDVADVITTVNYISGLNPKPFIFEAADVNEDEEIDILDIVGIIRTILNPSSSSSLSAEATASYFIDKNGVLYVDSPVGLAGIQLNLSLSKNGKVVGLDALNGFEQNGAWLSDTEYVFLAYNMSGKTVPHGLTPIALITEGDIVSMTLSDVAGHNVSVTRGTDEGLTGIDPLTETIKTAQKLHGVYTLSGVKLSNDVKDLKNLPVGIYIVNGEKVVNEK